MINQTRFHGNHKVIFTEYRDTQGYNSSNEPDAVIEFRELLKTLGAGSSFNTSQGDWQKAHVGEGTEKRETKFTVQTDHNDYCPPAKWPPGWYSSSEFVFGEPNDDDKKLRQFELSHPRNARIPRQFPDHRVDYESKPTGPKIEEKARPGDRLLLNWPDLHTR